MGTSLLIERLRSNVIPSEVEESRIGTVKFDCGILLRLRFAQDDTIFSNRIVRTQP